MFKRLYVDNYKSLVNFDLRLDELTLLLGVNGTGKTSVLDVVFALRQLLAGVAKVTDSGIFPARTLTRWQSLTRQAFGIEVDLSGDVLGYRLEIEHEIETRRARIITESLKGRGDILFSFEMGKVTLYRDDGSAGPEYHADWGESALARVVSRHDNRRLTRFLNFVRGTVVCSIYPASFRTESSAPDETVLRRDAGNFSTWYQSMQLEKPADVAELGTELGKVVDGFEGMRLEKVGLDTRALMVEFKENGNRYELRLDETSDGQRALIALYALLRLSDEDGTALFLDEPDNYVALGEIQPWLIELNDSCGEAVSQAILCSHHPELIDYLGDERARLLVRDNAGPTRMETLERVMIEGGIKLSEVIARGWER